MFSRKRTMRRKLLAISLIIMVASALFVLPVSASAVNPTTIGFHSTASTVPNFEAFYNLTSSVSGDVLFVAEGFVYYANPANEPTNIAGQSFNFEVLSPSNAIMQDQIHRAHAGQYEADGR